MKKFIFGVISVFVIISLIGCGGEPSGKDKYGNKIPQKTWVDQLSEASARHQTLREERSAKRRAYREARAKAAESPIDPLQKYDVKFLFEKDGIKVYQFSTGYRYHYFTTRGDTITIQSNGKTHTEETINGTN